MGNLAEVPIGDRFLGPGHFLTQLTGVGSLVSLLVRAALAISAIILLFYLILGGIGIISSAGKGDTEGTGKGKQMVTSAVIGFVIVFASYWIVRLIQIITGLNILG